MSYRNLTWAKCRTNIKGAGFNILFKKGGAGLPRETTLKRLRFQTGLHQKDMAERLQLTQQYYNEIENGRPPSFSLARRLAELFQVSVDELFPASDLNKTEKGGEQPSERPRRRRSGRAAG